MPSNSPPTEPCTALPPCHRPGHGAGFGGAFGSTGQIQVDVDGIESIDLSALAPSTLAIVIGSLVTLASGVVVSGVAGASFAELYRTRKPRP